MGCQRGLQSNAEGHFNADLEPSKPIGDQPRPLQKPSRHTTPTCRSRRAVRGAAWPRPRACPSSKSSSSASRSSSSSAPVPASRRGAARHRVRPVWLRSHRVLSPSLGRHQTMLIPPTTAKVAAVWSAWRDKQPCKGHAVHLQGYAEQQPCRDGLAHRSQSGRRGLRAPWTRRPQSPRGRTCASCGC